MKEHLLNVVDSIYNNIRNKIINNECDEKDINNAVVAFHPSVNKEYFKASDYCNYDEACKILRVPITNRVKLKSICNQYGVECVYVKNRPLGFPKREIERIAELMEEEIKKNDYKLRKKKGAIKRLW